MRNFHEKLIFLNVFLLIFLSFFFFYSQAYFAQSPPQPQTVQIVPSPPTPCRESSGCPSGIEADLNYTCASSYEDWLNDKTKNYWVNDDEVTYLGKQGERARQFTYWILTHKSIDNAPNIVMVWQQNRNIVYAFIIFIAAVFGITLMIQRKYFQASSLNIKEKIIKIALLLLYTTFSFSIVILLIQLTDILSAFFIEKLGVKNIFNIFFLPLEQSGSVIQKSEQAYLNFQGCRNLNINLNESVRTSMFLVKITNLTYFILGIMLLLRKILLWFLLIISPFLAILAPFIFIRNIGWIWIGVFFQWLFYGPLVALFLGVVATIWNNFPYIPFNFDFSRVNNPSGFIYQTGINILYGGPAQTLTFSNTSNYVDTFAEYITSLLMLWATIFFPWWLLRIFRDYCCEGIMATKNILMSIYDQMRGGPNFPPSPSWVPSTITSTALKIPKKTEIPVQIRLEKIEEIKKARTEEIARALNLSVSKLTDIASFETNRQMRETIIKNLNYLQNPTQATTPTERQKYMNIRTELFNRAIKEDRIAKQILSSISTSKIEQMQRREEFLKSTPHTRTLNHMISIKLNLPVEKVSAVTSSFIQNTSQHIICSDILSKTTKLPQEKINLILNSYVKNITNTPTQVINKISTETNISKEKVIDVIKHVNTLLKQIQFVDRIAKTEQIAKESVFKVVETITNIISREEFAQPISQYISYQTGISENQVNSVVNKLIKQVSSDLTTLNQIQNQTSLTHEQIKNIINSFPKNIGQNVAIAINNIAQEVGVSKEKVKETISYIMNLTKASKEVIEKTSKKELVKEEQIEKIIQNQIPIVIEPERNIEETINIPPTVSIEDYEQVKRMWKNHYEKGEIPVSDNITSREQWLENDIVFITNTLNKLLSNDKKLQQEGLEEVGYILPIFLVNNLTSEQLIVYLKAKLEAAKEVRKEKEQEEIIKEKLKTSSEEELVEVKRPKVKEAQKTLQMEEEIK